MERIGILDIILDFVVEPENELKGEEGDDVLGVVDVDDDSDEPLGE